MPGNDLLSHGNSALPSAMHRFTAEFGMGSGGSNALISPGKPFETRRVENVLNLIQDLSMHLRHLLWIPDQVRDDGLNESVP